MIEGVLNDLRAMAQDERRVLRIIDELHHEALEVSEMMAPMARKAKQFVFYQGGVLSRRGRDRAADEPAALNARSKSSFGT